MEKQKTKKLQKTPKESTEETNKKAITQKVIVHKELKYIYPKGCTNTLARKAFRQKVRNALRKMERDLKKLEGKELKIAEAALATYRKEVVVN